MLVGPRYFAISRNSYGYNKQNKFAKKFIRIYFNIFAIYKKRIFSPISDNKKMFEKNVFKNIFSSQLQQSFHLFISCIADSSAPRQQRPPQLYKNFKAALVYIYIYVFMASINALHSLHSCTLCPFLHKDLQLNTSNNSLVNSLAVQESPILW